MAGGRLSGSIARGAAGLSPAYFALVMATGILSIALLEQGLGRIAKLLFGLNLVFYAGLAGLTALRLLRHLPRVVADLTSHSRGPGFFTLVAGTCVLGRQFQLLAHEPGVELLLWLSSLGLWLFLIYAFLAAVTVREPKPGLASGLNGGWLLLVVATQSLAVTGARIAAGLGPWKEATLGLTLALFLLGGMLYLLIISLIFYRFTFFPLTPQKLAPPYWINMGAVAITSLAGATLLAEAGDWRLIRELAPLLEGLSFLAWAVATWWIPLLVVLLVWRHAYHHFPLAYDPSYWGMVFPLGMYSAASFALSRATGLAFPLPIARATSLVALAAWSVVFAGLLRRAVTGLRRGAGAEAAGAAPGGWGFAEARPPPGAPFIDYVGCPYCAEPEVEACCYQRLVRCHNCGRAFARSLPPGCPSASCAQACCPPDPDPDPRPRGPRTSSSVSAPGCPGSS